MNHDRLPEANYKNMEIKLKYFIVFLIVMPSFSQITRLDLESFEKVWSIINEKHWDLQSTGVDWKKVHDKYLPQAEKAKNRTELREIIRSMIGELGQTHFGLLQSETFESLKMLESKLVMGSGVPGFETETVKNHIMVVKINTPGTGHIPVGTEILEIRHIPAQMIIEALDSAYSKSKQKELYTTRILQSFFSGSPGTELPLKLRKTNSNQVENVEIPLSMPHGISQQLGDLPPMTFQFEQEILPGNIGYISFNIFLFPLTQLFPKALQAFGGCEGLIIDLRGNGGGIGFLASTLAGYLSHEKGRLGTMYSKDSEVNFPVLPRPNVWGKPVAIIVNGGSASTSEIFAAGIQDLGLGRIFGTQTAGAALPSFIEPLPNGDLFQYAFASYKSVKGRYLEGNGVMPDEVTPHTLATLKQGKDASIEAATKWILKQNTEKKQ